MRVPVNERVKEAPAQALRAMFAGIGQLLLVTDRLRNRAPEGAPAADTPDEALAASTSEATAPAAEAPASPAAKAPAEPAAEAAETVVATEASVTANAAEAPAATASDLPLPNYDELTVPSLRARMRPLSADQLNSLISYEQSHANRADVISMFERRIAKLTEA